MQSCLESMLMILNEGISWILVGRGIVSRWQKREQLSMMISEFIAIIDFKR